MTMTHDIIIIGAGSGGLNIASFMNKAGFSVLLIDKSDRSIGGDCLNFGCVPSKAFIHVANLVGDAKKARSFGLSTSGTVDMKKVKEYVSSKVEFIREHENADYFQKLGIDVVLGNASFVGPKSVKVNDKVYSAPKIILATGSRPAKIDIEGSENVDFLTNETIFDLEELPKTLLIIGTGPIGMELGQAFAKLGSKVIVVQRNDHFLKKEDSRISSILLEQMKKEGVEFFFHTSLVRFNDAHTLVVTRDGKQISISFDRALLGVGRKLNIENLDLQRAGIQKDQNGEKLIVNDYLQTTNKQVYVCGDVAGGYQFTHMAELHAGVIIRNFFSPFKKKMNLDSFSWVTFTDPQIATFGLSKKELEKRNISYQELFVDFEHVDRAITDDAQQGKLLLYVYKNKVVGGSMVAKDAGELIQELVLANTNELSVGVFFNKIYAYPVATRINKKAIGELYKNKLTPFVKKLFHVLYNIF